MKIINLKNEKKIGECYRSYDLYEGEQIDIISTKKSVYGYLSIEGGFLIDSFCKSVSTFSTAGIGPNEGKKISVKDKIFFKTIGKEKENYKINYFNKISNKIRVLKGPQFEYFSEASKKDFLSSEYKITNLTDRMGMRLQGNNLKNIISTNIRSEGIIKGSIQVPADGQPIILLNDHPTVGGYPKIANVISADYDLLIQNAPGTKLLFQCIELDEAENAFEIYNKNIRKLLESKTVVK